MSSKFETRTDSGSAIKIASIFIAISVGSCLNFGCESTGSKKALNTAVADYNAQHYLSAQRRSTEVARKANGRLKDQATYLAGLSAYKLGDFIEAELQLTKAVKSPDQATAARAKAVLGLMRVDQDRPSDAAGLLNEASLSMNGADSRQAAYQAALAHEEAGGQGQAYSSRQINSYRTPRIQSGFSDPIAGSKVFSLQAGAFHDRNRAVAAAENIAGIAQANDLGNVRIIKNRDNRGRALFIVQLGRFASRFDASDIHRQIGRKDLIVAPLAKPTL